MKATIEIPDELYRKVKAKSSNQGQPVGEVAIKLLRAWIGETRPAARRDQPLPRSSRSRPSWFGLARKYARNVNDHGMPAVRESIAKGWAKEMGEKEARLRRGKTR